MTAGTGTGERTVTSRDGTAIGYETVGQGEGVLVLGGAWRTARDYLRFARALADPFAVHLIDRRGRGRSGPQGASYSIEREIEDLIAVMVRGAGGAPPIVERLPVWYLRLVLRVFIRDRAWQRIDSLMEAALAGALTAAIPDAAAEIIPGLDHVAPDEKAPDVVAARVREHLAG